MKIRIKSVVLIPIGGKDTLEGIVVGRSPEVLTVLCENGDLWRGSVYEVELIKH